MTSLKRSQTTIDLRALEIILNKHGYEVEKDIGHGAQGCCYVVFSEHYKTKFVAKCMQAKEGNEELVNRQFKREVYSLTHITHPNIVKIYDYFTEGKYIFMIIEYCENGNLLSLVSPDKRPFANQRHQYFNQIRNYFKDVLSALDYCHNDMRISHHDIKPHNIVIDSYNHAKLCDFGLSQKIKEHISNIDDENVSEESQEMIDILARSDAQNIGGSPFFMSPQILKCYFHPHEHFDMFAADIWAFGVTAYILICFRYPFVGRTKREVYDMQKALIDGDFCHINQYYNKEMDIFSHIPKDTPEDLQLLLKRSLVFSEAKRAKAVDLYGLIAAETATTLPTIPGVKKVNSIRLGYKSQLASFVQVSRRNSCITKPKKVPRSLPLSIHTQNVPHRIIPV